MGNMRNWLGMLAVVLLAGCSSVYKPTPHVKQMSASMSDEQAMEALRDQLTVRNQKGELADNLIQGYSGLCNSNGFAIEGHNGGNVKVTKDGFTVSAFRKGKLIKTEGGINYYEKIPYREDLRLENIKSVTLKEPGLLGTSCGRKEGQTEVAIRETFVRWYAVLIPTEEKERFVAALLRLSPNLKIQED